MKLKYFQIKNFKSIQNSGVCYLPSPDNITILAGQNESGKSSVLQALYAFETGIISSDDIPEGLLPEIHCRFIFDPVSICEPLEEKLEISSDVLEYFENVSELTVSRYFKSAKESEISVPELFGDGFLKAVKNHNNRVNQESKDLQLYKDSKHQKAKYEEELSILLDSDIVNQPNIDKLRSLLFNIQQKIAELEKLPSLIKNIELSNFMRENDIVVAELLDKKKSLELQSEDLKKKLDNEDFEDEEDEDTVQADINKLNLELKNVNLQLTESKKKSQPALEEFKKRKEILSVISDDKVTELKKNILDLIWNYLPLFIFFDDFCDLLPDKMFIKDLVEKKDTVQGYQAVKNMEAILKADFAALDKQNDSKREMNQDTYKDSITADFNERWKQKISDGSGATIHVKYNQGRVENGAYLTFYINTKKSEFLHPAQRSQGFKWFLSFFLHLKAEDTRRGKLIILFDEPGLYLHSKAQNDMLMVFDELADKNQIIYSTHSPYLIDSKKLHRVRLVINSKDHGTTVEKITTAKLKNQPNAIKPIADAIGLDVASNFSVVHRKNVLLEGLSDFYYFTAMKKLICPKDDFAFIPSMGSSNVHLLMELCIGWGLEWLIVFDKSGVEDDYKKIVKNFFDGKDNEAKDRITILSEDGIEDLFSEDDIKLVEPAFASKGRNSISMKAFGGKELLARLFLDKVDSGEIKRESLSANTITNFTEVFKFVKKGFK